MKITPKRVAILILCIIIAFIPTYVAITYYLVKENAPVDGYYTVVIKDSDGKDVPIDSDDMDSVAKTVLDINSKMYKTAGLSNEQLPEKYYDISVISKDFLTSYRYYFSTEENTKSIVRGTDGAFYYLDYKDAKNFLALPCAYSFYDHASLPTLSIFGGDDVSPIDAKWEYEALNGNTVPSNISLGDSSAVHAMNSTTKLSFSLAPDKCSVKVSQNGQLIASTSSLAEIPYDKLESGTLTFEIYAEWNSSDKYSGYAKYKFTSKLGLAPEFFINKTTVQSGEFFLVYASNVSAPQKIEFSSSPSINYKPVFFEENNMVYALIPIDKNLSAPQNYEFSFTYGEKISKIKVSVTQRNIIDRGYDCSSISSLRTESNVSEYNKLLNDIGLTYESRRYFSNDKFIDYSMTNTNDVATIVLGYGHRRIPDNNDEAFRLDGVDYFIAGGTNVTAIASGKVVHIGESALLGKFVVIDHGLGLKTWYCSLSETSTSVGATVAKGDMIGKPGATGYKNTVGVYLITTVMNVPICPYSLQEDGLTLPK